MDEKQQYPRMQNPALTIEITLNFLNILMVGLHYTTHILAQYTGGDHALLIHSMSITVTELNVPM